MIFKKRHYHKIRGGRGVGFEDSVIIVTSQKM